ncbi:SGNH/GDSL hydrolase family protein [Rhodococcus rhodnii]|nr:SGNH/GDSL hydrolase family protein [Rhodococcus rhodnii]
MRRLSTVAATTIGFWVFMAVGVVTIVAGTVYASVRPAPDSDYVSTYASPTAAAAAPVRAVVLGDAYSEGAGAESSTQGFAMQVGSKFCWDTVVLGQSGTGYTVPAVASEGRASFPDRVADVVAASPDVVVVQGSTIDTGGVEQTEAASAVFGGLRAALPQASIVAIGPVAAPGVGQSDVLASRDAVAEAAQAHGVVFLDPVEKQWLAQPEHFTDGGVVPSAAGHTAFAEAIAAELTTMGAVRSGC